MSPPPDALRIALEFLRRADRTEAELRAHLARRSVGPEEADRVVGTLRARRYLDDSRVAEREAELAQGSRPEGRERLRARLLRRGAAETAVEEALGQYTEADERRLAEEALRGRPDRAADPARAARYLLGRGFGDDAVRAALEAVFPDLEA